MQRQTVAIYARTSKEYKNVERISIDQQVDDARRLAKTKNLPGEVQPYIDADRSGSLLPQQWLEGQRRYRENFTRLIADIENGKISCLICRKLDRLARGTEMTLRLIRLLSAHKVRLLATDETLPGADDDSGMFTLTILAAAAEYELKKISSNTRRALAYIKREGGKIGSAGRTLGYKDSPEKGKAEIEPTGAELVAQIFARFVNGESLRSIGKWLTDAQPDGKRVGYYSNHITRMLRNPHYIGMREYEGKLEPSKVYPAIVDPAIYWQAHEILKNRKGIRYGRHANQNQQPHQLSGLLKCGHCGRNLQWAKRGRDYQARCIWRHATGFTQFRMGESRWLEWAESFFAPMMQINREPVTNPDRALALTKLERITANIASLQAKFASGDLNADLLTGALELATVERDKVTRQLDAMPPADQPTYKAWAEMTFDEKRRALLTMIERVDVHADKVAVTFAKHTNRQPMTFPLMKRRAQGSNLKAVHCLTPYRLTTPEASRVETPDSATVNWQAYVCDRRGNRDAYKSTAQFYYANPAHADVSPPKQGRFSYRTADGKTFATTNGKLAGRLLATRLTGRLTLAGCEALAATGPDTGNGK